jgi:hypothetical protein
VNPVPHPLLLGKLGRAGIESGTSGLAARNSDHWTTEAVRHVSKHGTDKSKYLAMPSTSHFELLAVVFVDNNFSQFICQRCSFIHLVIFLY